MKTTHKLLIALALLLVAGLAAQAAEQSRVKVIDQKQYKALFQSGKKIKRAAVVDFNATWCGPCRKLSPILEELAKQYKGKVDFYSIDVDANPELTAQLGITNIPYIVLIPKKGTPQATKGLMPKQSYADLIDRLLLGKKPKKK